MSQENRTHETQPSSETSELIFRELHVTPQEAVTDDLQTVVSNTNLHHEFMCPICLDTLKNTLTAKECLHRFCADCIITALRRGNKECPICRKKLVSKRSLDPDPEFDALISKMYPSREECEAPEEEVLARSKKHKTLKSLRGTFVKRWKTQARSRDQQGRKLQNKSGSGTEDNDNSPQCSNASTQQPGNRPL